MVKTIQLGIRIEKDLVERIEFLAKEEGIDRNLWIKRALGVFVADEEDGIIDGAIEDYINLRIDEETLIEITDFKKVPEDIKKAREKRLNHLLEEK